MTFIDFLGFIITFILFIYLSGRKVWQASRGVEPYEDEELPLEEKIREGMRSPEYSERREPSRMPPPLPVKNRDAIKPKKKVKRTVDSRFEVAKGSDPYRSISSLENRELKSTIESLNEEAYKLSASHEIGGESNASPYAINSHEDERPSIGLKSLGRCKSTKEMIIIHEIIGKPRAFQDYEVNCRQLL